MLKVATGIEIALFGHLAPVFARCLAKVWAADPNWSGATADVGELLLQGGVKYLERRRLGKELEGVGERAVQRLQPYLESNELKGTSANEVASAILVAARAFDVAITESGGPLGMNMDPATLEARALEAAPPLELRDLSDAGRQVFSYVVRETSIGFVQAYAELPRFTSDALIDLLQRNSALEEMVAEALAALPAPEYAANEGFEARYRSSVTRRLDKLELIGLTEVSQASRRYAMSIAYVSMDAESFDTPNGAAGEWEDPPQAGRRVEQFVADNVRVMLVGEAGSGKTTALQWLAVQAAKKGFEGDLTRLNEHLPFFIRLRDYADRDFPTIEELPKIISGPAFSSKPKHWCQRLFDQGKALVLVDGLDELPYARRDDALVWLESLVHAGPRCRYVVTTRPAGLEGIQRSNGFAWGRLAPMDLKDVKRFVAHWYAAASVNDGQPEVAGASSARSLFSLIRDVLPLRQLATNPLMCAVVCALHREHLLDHTAASRLELYEAALHLLLEKRDAGRKLTVDTEIQLTRKQKLVLLTELAWWMLRNDYAVVSHEAARAQVEVALKLMSIERSGEDVLALLLARTGLLRQPAADQIDFVHKTFLEYLAARRAVEVNDVGLLISRADDAPFHEVVVLAAGLAPRTVASQLIRGLLERDADKSPSSATATVLAAQAAQLAAEVEPDLQVQIARTLALWVPPRTMSAAEQLARAGDLAVGLLVASPNSTAEEAACSVRALAMIGTDAALEQLAPYGADSRRAVQRELISGWDRFERSRFAESVMAQAPLFGGSLTVSEADSLYFLKPLKRLTHLKLETRVQLDWETVSELRLHRLSIETARGLRDLRPFVGAADLVRLSVRHAPNLRDLRGLDALALSELYVWAARTLASVDTLADAPPLSRLELLGTQLGRLEALSRQTALTHLSLGGRGIESVGPLASLALLEELRLVGMSGSVSLVDLSGSSQLARISLDDWQSLPVLASFGSRGRPLSYLRISNCPGLASLERLNHFGHVRKLDLRKLRLQSLRGLNRNVDGLRTLTLWDCDLESLAGVPETVDTLEVTRGHTRLLRTLDRIPELAEIRLTNMKSVDLADLATCQNLRKVEVSGGSGSVKGWSHLAALKSLESIDPGPHRGAACAAGLEELLTAPAPVGPKAPRLALGS